MAMRDGAGRAHVLSRDYNSLLIVSLQKTTSRLGELCCYSRILETSLCHAICCVYIELPALSMGLHAAQPSTRLLNLEPLGFKRQRFGLLLLVLVTQVILVLLLPILASAGMQRVHHLAGRVTAPACRCGPAATTIAIGSEDGHVHVVSLQVI
jgi:hypothetical protein